MKRKLSLSESGLSDEVPPGLSTAMSRSSRRRGRRGTLSSSASPFHRLFTLCLSSPNPPDATTSAETTFSAGSSPQRVEGDILPHSNSRVCAEATSAIAPPPVEVPTSDEAASDRCATAHSTATATLTTRDETQTGDYTSHLCMYAGKPYRSTHEQDPPRYPASPTTLAQPAFGVGTSIGGDLYFPVAYSGGGKHGNSPHHQTGFRWVSRRACVSYLLRSCRICTASQPGAPSRESGSGAAARREKRVVSPESIDTGIRRRPTGQLSGELFTRDLADFLDRLLLCSRRQDNPPGWSPALSMASTSPSLQTPALTSASSSSLASSHETISTLPSSTFTHFSALPPTTSPPLGYASAATSLDLAQVGSGDALAASANFAGADSGGLAAVSPRLAGEAKSAYDVGLDAHGELQHFTMDEDTQVLRMPTGVLQMDPAGGPEEEQRSKKATLPPADVQRRGEDLGLSLGDFDMLDTLG